MVAIFLAAEIKPKKNLNKISIFEQNSSRRHLINSLD